MMEEHERAQSALFELTARSEEERAAQAAQGDIAAAEVWASNECKSAHYCINKLV
jgi:hypothetical protein